MFLCEGCHKKCGCTALARAYGPCEGCGQKNNCGDCQTRHRKHDQPGFVHLVLVEKFGAPANEAGAVKLIDWMQGVEAEARATLEGVDGARERLRRCFVELTTLREGKIPWMRGLGRSELPEAGRDPKPTAPPPPEPEWHRDPAASGWRSRAWLDDYELVAYDDGRWEVRRGNVFSGAAGQEVDAEAAKRRALKVYLAFTSPM